MKVLIKLHEPPSCLLWFVIDDDEVLQPSLKGLCLIKKPMWDNAKMDVLRQAMVSIIIDDKMISMVR